MRALLFVLGVLAVLPLTQAPANALAARSLLPSQAAWTAALNWAVCVAVAFATLAAARLEQRSFGDYGYPRSRAGIRSMEGFAWGVAMASLAAAVVRVSGAAEFQVNGLAASAAIASGAAWWLSRLGLAALDQLLWRGYLQVLAARSLGFWPAAWVMTAVFTVEKLLVPESRHAIPIATYLAWGLLSALMLRRTGALWFGTGMQLGLDWGLLFLYGLDVPGASSHPAGSLMDAVTHDALLTGGQAGMRGSVLMPVLTCLAAMLVGVRFAESRGSASQAKSRA